MKRCVVSVAAEFEVDVDQQLSWLDANGRSQWAARLFDEVNEVGKLLENFPRLGEADEPPFRRILLKTLPFAVWYTFEQKENRVHLMRLFHFRRYR